MRYLYIISDFTNKITSLNEEVSDDEYKRELKNEISIIRIPFDTNIENTFKLEPSDNFYTPDTIFEQSYVQMSTEQNSSIPMG